MKIAIIGAGPAGIYTSLLLSGFSGEVHLFEQNDQIGMKLERTGGGRMNIANKVFSEKQFSSTQPNLLKKLFKNPWIKNRMDIFDELSVEYNWEENRALLKSQNATKEIYRLNDELVDQENVTINLVSKVVDIEKKDDQYLLKIRTDGAAREEIFDTVVIAGGGMFKIDDLGPEEEIYKLPLRLGHTITSLSPSLSSLMIKNNPLMDFSGISLLAELTDAKTRKKMLGNTLITHNGLSGPLPLDFSSILEGDNIEMNFLPETNEEDFTKEFNNLRQGKNNIKTFLKKFLPGRLAEWQMKQAEIQEGGIIADVSKEKFKILRKRLFHFRLNNITKLDYPFCWTTKGGVDLGEINVGTMESKLHKNLYFTGEILDVNGFCGGYNISFAAICAKIVSERILM